MKSGTAIGALVRESAKAESKKDFTHKLSIASKEAFETFYWLELIEEIPELRLKLPNLKKECQEIIKILNSIILTTKQNNS